MDALLTGVHKLITAPSEEPVSLEEVKAHLRIEHADEDVLLTGLINAARTLVENQCWRALVTQTRELYLSNWPAGAAIELPYPPLQSITSFTYTDYLNAATVWASTNYLVDTVNEPGRLVLAYDADWPTATLKPLHPIAVRYVAGYGAAADVPELLKTAIRLIVGHWYENREATVIGAGLTVSQLPLAVQSILAMYEVRG